MAIIRAMMNTIGYHIVISGYGLWLPGDDRGHWSERWDEHIGLIEPRTLHDGDPVRKRMAEERMKHPPVRLNPRMIDIVANTIGRCADHSDWDVAAASIEPTHAHLLLTYTPRNIDTTVKWIKTNARRPSIAARITPVWFGVAGNGVDSFSMTRCGETRFGTSSATMSDAANRPGRMSSLRHRHHKAATGGRVRGGLDHPDRIPYASSHQ